MQNIQKMQLIQELQKKMEEETQEGDSEAARRQVKRDMKKPTGKICNPKVIWSVDPLTKFKTQDWNLA